METILKLALAPSSLHPADPNILWYKFQKISKDEQCIKNPKKRPEGKIFFEINSADNKKLINLLGALSKEVSSAMGRSAHFDLYPRDLPGHKITILPSN